MGAARVLACFPAPSQYDVYIEPFVGAASVLLRKPRWGHIEAVNDINNDLMNFWQCMRSSRAEMQARLSALPYSHALRVEYRRSLYGGVELGDIERACRWFYVLRTGYRAQVSRVNHGWRAGKRDYPAEFAHALELFEAVASRLVGVQVDNRDFEPFVRLYESSRTLMYCDPPYVGGEHYYDMGNEKADAFHTRLAAVLNASPSLIILSYCPVPELDVLYPVSKWRRVEWQRSNPMQRLLDKQERVTELLLCNFCEDRGLWEAAGDSVFPRPGDVA